MKKYFTLLLICLSATTFVEAQSISILSLNRSPWGDMNETIIQSQGLIENSSSNTLDVKVRRITEDTVPGTQNYFCWEQCYEPQVSESPTAMTMTAGMQTDFFYADYKPRGNAGVSTLVYCFYDANNEADSTCATVRFSASPTGIQDVFMGDESGISESYPNPAKTVAKINYALKAGWQKAEVVVYSMLGSKVRELKLKQDQGTLKLDVSTLPSGMYFYSLMVDDKAINTKKMLVTK